MFVIGWLVWLVIETIVFSLVAQVIGYLCFRERIPNYRAGLSALCAYIVLILLSGFDIGRSYLFDPRYFLLYIVPATISFGWLYHRYDSAWLEEAPADHFE